MIIGSPMSGVKRRDWPVWQRETGRAATANIMHVLACALSTWDIQVSLYLKFFNFLFQYFLSIVLQLVFLSIFLPFPSCAVHALHLPFRSLPAFENLRMGKSDSANKVPAEDQLKSLMDRQLAALEARPRKRMSCLAVYLTTKRPILKYATNSHNTGNPMHNATDPATAMAVAQAIESGVDATLASEVVLGKNAKTR